jgi:hypothetical protein
LNLSNYKTKIVTMRKYQLAILCLCAFFISATPVGEHASKAPTVTITTTSLDITSANGVTMHYVIRGFEAKTLSGVDHGSCLNTTSNPEVNKNGSIQSKGVASTIDQKGKPAPAGVFYCAAYTKNLTSGTKYFVRPYVKLSNGSIIYGSEKSVTMK